MDALFTAGGEQKQLQAGQILVWTSRNELLKVTPVVCDGSTDDSERYRYDAGSQRLLKVSIQKTGSSTQTQRALYLPGLELRSTKSGDTENSTCIERMISCATVPYRGKLYGDGLGGADDQDIWL